MQKTILMTGGTGFLGSKLLRRLLDEEFRIVLLKRSTSNLRRIEDLTARIQTYDLDTTKLEDVFSRHKIDIVAHCATDYGRKDVPAPTVIEANLVLPLQLLELAKAHSVPVFINTDT